MKFFLSPGSLAIVDLSYWEIIPADVIRISWLDDIPENIFFIILGGIEVGAERFLIGVETHRV